MEEIGMTNCPFRREDLRDIEVVNQIKEFEEEGKLFDAREMLSGLRRKYFGS